MAEMPMQRALCVQTPGGRKLPAQVALFYHSGDDKRLGDMHIVAFIDQAPAIGKILRCLEIWHTHNHDPPTKTAVAAAVLSYDNSFSQLPAYADAF